MDVRIYLNLIRRNILVLILIPALFGAVTYYRSSQITKAYTASATILLKPNDPTEQFGSSGNTGTDLSLGIDTLARSLAEERRGGRGPASPTPAKLPRPRRSRWAGIAACGRQRCSWRNSMAARSHR